MSNCHQVKEFYSESSVSSISNTVNVFHLPILSCCFGAYGQTSLSQRTTFASYHLPPGRERENLGWKPTTKQQHTNIFSMRRQTFFGKNLKRNARRVLHGVSNQYFSLSPIKKKTVQEKANETTKVHTCPHFCLRLLEHFLTCCWTFSFSSLISLS